jgi:hypothetical protein
VADEGDDAYTLRFATPSSTYEVCLAGFDIDQLIEEMSRVRNEEIEAKVQAVGLAVPDIVVE